MIISDGFWNIRTSQRQCVVAKGSSIEQTNIMQDDAKMGYHFQQLETDY